MNLDVPQFICSAAGVMKEVKQDWEDDPFKTHYVLTADYLKLIERFAILKSECMAKDREIEKLQAIKTPKPIIQKVSVTPRCGNCKHLDFVGASGSPYCDVSKDWTQMSCSAKDCKAWDYDGSNR